MGLDRETCRGCVLTYVRRTFVPGAFDDEQLDLFARDWERGEVRCPGVLRLPATETPMRVGESGRFIFESFVGVGGPIPGCCLEKEGQLGPEAWGAYLRALELNGELLPGEVVATAEER